MRGWRPLGRLWLEGAPGDRYRAEEVVVTARAFLGLALFATLVLGPNLGGDSGLELTLRHGLVIGYVLYSFAVLLAVDVFRRTDRTFVRLVHATDLAWAGAVTLLIESSRSPSFLLFVFVLLAAAYRWGFWETLLTSIAAIGILLAEAWLVTFFQPGMFAVGEGLAAVPLALRLIHLWIVGVLVGYLGEEAKLLRFESSAAVEMMGLVRSERGLTGSIQAVAASVLQMFSAREFVLVMTDLATGRLFKVSSRAVPGTSELEHTSSELPRERQPIDFFEAPHTWSASARGLLWRKRFDLTVLNDEGRRVRPRFRIPDTFRATYPFRTLLCVSFRFDEAWAARLYLIDPPRSAAHERRLRLLRRLAGPVGNAVYGLYLFRTLRTRTGAIERARVARELHDGVIQSLIAVEMRMNVLKRHFTAPSQASVNHELEQLRGVVHDEVLNLRDLMQQMKPSDLGPKQLLDYLADLVDRFRRDTGIAARFVSEMQDVPLRQPARRELARIAQEALVNARKHSGARNVVVKLELRDGACCLVVDDDGRGYDFEGRFTRDELDRARRGPVVIKERVHAIGGNLTLESMPGRGTRLEVTVPLRA